MVSWNLESSNDSNSTVYSSIPSVSHSTSYVNQCLTAETINEENFYVMPRQENPHTNENSTELSSTPPNPTDTAQIYATPPSFAKNFVLESNVSFDDRDDLPSVSLDTVPDLINGNSSSTNDIYYSYPQAPPPVPTSAPSPPFSTNRSVR